MDRKRIRRFIAPPPRAPDTGGSDRRDVALERKRILVGLAPGLLRDIVAQQLDACRDLAVVGFVSDAAAFAAAVAQVAPDAAVIGVPGPIPASAVESLLWERPRMAIVVLEGDGERAVLHRMRPQRSVVGDLSADGLVRLLTGA